MSTANNAWYVDFFHGFALDFWSSLIPAEITRTEADFLEGLFSAERHGTLLDVPCGDGRLSLELAGRGFRCTGVDIAERYIEEASGKAGLLGLPAGFIRADMASMELSGPFSGAFCWGNSFGYLGRDACHGFLCRIARSLQAGSRFVIDTSMAAECILPNLEKQAWYEAGGIRMSLKNRYQVSTGCLETDYIFERGPEVERRTARHFVFTSAEILRMLEKAGLRALEMFSGTDRGSFRVGAPRLIVVAARS